ncbi:tRNA nucleotidyltransferase cca2-like isoform X1 [Gastrolobium bilobum]|uniref:tRNA nucleotidyltransferase cca2-like isoform X1 n=2 Tax=Gastrolobium bilobum TaxID=150636 RepID=UPI002AB1C882|nr:tRNA nucleotidyltransferase cca2-like isoform X1 [Gastrolobium bilobum]XP_061366582.1 tRNA nucleotidyltransferase cca2-like isoform X1 [Gastrolobium bilobum]XP_061366583.1 tRNA nucleotidyltransferase cca2-like isoform X1 [Gastrolobium bilobum]XP_061366585.1 tRNA nucleotidyltransferase cca2-like isoform X1 [Gastrolobium bilobum]XP_061366586.1 tRNA nucleotidyltransferase cca2-like isoform X1 [Gastrolobium bilobum]
MRLALKTATSLVVLLPRPKLSCLSLTRTVVVPLHSHRPAKTLVRTTTPSFQSCVCAPMSTQQVFHVRDKIELSDTEKSIFDRLLATLRHFQLQTQLRVAGGWVRDKLLGKDCYDIDIALDNMMGAEFVYKVKEYLLSIGEDVQGVCVIECNPDQSKHLETARMRLFDTWIDFVNLRSEEYTENSRIPSKQRFGTAEEDAYRRDLTINSLFYNINTDLVEDFTKRGISDLKSGKIVTPLPPKATFLDDPLRVLRAIRFGARFGFTLDEDLKGAAACDDVKDALAAKISRERIGTEIDLMISGNQPVKAMTYICELTIFWIVFSLPPEFEPAISDGCERLCISFLDTAWNLAHLLGDSTFTAEQRRLTLYAALFLPLRNITYTEKKAKKIPVVNHIIREALKRKAKDAEMVLDLHRASYKFLSLIPCLSSAEDVQIVDLDWMTDLIDVPVSSRVRVLTGFLLRELRDFWRVALLISTILHPIDINSIEDEPSQLGKRRDLFNTVENSIIKLGLEKVWDLKQLINGKDVMNALQLKGGPLVKEWLDKAMAWQLAHPSGTTEECIEWLRQTNSKRIKLE